jgi:hypothetical protein
MISALASINATLAGYGGPTLSTYYGIYSVKAWISTANEPPDQSGHGTYDGEHYKYADKYHTPIVGGDNTVTSYTYNPRA